MPIPDTITQLIQRYEDNRESYRSAHYNEAQVRQEFLNPFFAALGWDVDNTQGYAEAYKDVIHEDTIKVGGATKAPDYSFRIGGTRKFFLEAKKPLVYLKLDKSAAFQLRRYAWSAKLPLSILTNFAEFAVYDCRFAPEKDDPAAKARLFYFTYKEYAEKWEEIASIFSKTAILKGSFDRYAEGSKGKRGTAEVDAAFLNDIENWRSLLARNLALRNPALTQRQLNFAVQRTIDRIVFLRICEDRSIEPYGQLQALLNGKNAYARLCTMLQAADDRYNSGLFHFGPEKGRDEEPDDLTLGLQIDDKTLQDILRGLYYPDSPYVFSVVPADILGQAYEQFLGKVIRLTDGHRAVIEDKPEVKKAGGVYYTPTYIVDYIVTQTVGNLLQDRTPKEAAALRILDPACGSGSFLIGAYQHILDWHRDWYVADGPEKWSKGKHATLYAAGDKNGWRLTTAERKRILLNNIYGVDIDAQAVEVSKLSLLLKVLEGENAETVSSNLKLFKERALPDLGHNIKCGNSLIGPDFYDDPKMADLDMETQLRINAFDWQSEFAGIMKAGGFDAVIGNPPYNASLLEEEENYLERKYISVKTGRQDTAAVFVEAGVRHKRSRVMMLLPYRLISRKRNHGGFQRWLFHETFINQIVYIGKLDDIGANDEFMIGAFTSDLDGSSSKNSIQICERATKFDFLDHNLRFVMLPQIEWGPPNYHMSIGLLALDMPLLNKIKHCSCQLSVIAESRDGIVPFIRDKMLNISKKDNRYKPLLGIRGFYTLDRYRYTWKPIYICYDISEAKKYIKEPKELRKVQLRDEVIFQQPEKIITSQDSIIIKGTLDVSYFYTTNSIHATYLKDTTIGYNIRYVLGLMNSRLLNYFHKSLATKGEDLHPQILVSNLKKLPIHTINFDDPADKAKHDKMVTLVEKMLTLHNELPGKMGQEKTVMQRQIETTDKQIDALVYELYGLTDEEIKIVEGGS